MTISITAVVCCRNEAIYLKNLLPYCAEEGIEVALIDHGSDDGSKDIFCTKNYPNLVSREDLSFDGVFDLSAQLLVKANLIEKLKSDWVIHQDADEVLHSPDSWGGLRESFEEAHDGKFNALNFNELVMLPSTPSIDDYMSNNRSYYFFEPRPLRLMRAWRRSADLTNVASGGHILLGKDLYVFPRLMILKHFMVRSQRHAIEKFVGRKFAEGDLAKGWHEGRSGLTADMLTVPQFGPCLHSLETPQSSPEKLPRSVKAHFWQWRR